MDKETDADSDAIYNPVVPCTNRYLQQLWDTASYERHVRRLKTIKPAVDNRAAEYTRSNEKGNRALQDRASEIDRKNNLLLKKLSHIYQRKNDTCRKVDQRVNPFHETRLREMKRIDRDNQFIINRLKKISEESCYSREKLQQERDESLRHAKRISHYPHLFVKRHGELRPITAPSDGRHHHDKANEARPNRSTGSLDNPRTSVIRPIENSKPEGSHYSRDRHSFSSSEMNSEDLDTDQTHDKSTQSPTEGRGANRAKSKLHSDTVVSTTVRKGEEGKGAETSKDDHGGPLAKHQGKRYNGAEFAKSTYGKPSRPSSAKSHASGTSNRPISARSPSPSFVAKKRAPTRVPTSTVPAFN